MNKVIRCKNNNNRKVFVLLLLQVFLGICPVLLLLFFVLFHLYETQITAIVAIALIFVQRGLQYRRTQIQCPQQRTAR